MLKRIGSTYAIVEKDGKGGETILVREGGGMGIVNETKEEIGLGDKICSFHQFKKNIIPNKTFNLVPPPSGGTN
jgi:hypothetical protein